ncbi:unnamed protein product [Candidula unifasciata]|uniref:Uncharacterized protein n=1 Tax=Candidula unifasciata TaxID=100452 RepID=A0A8S3Z904_9EUPU|nr:unnamed protein product [Candidula unifasciata]
MSLSTFTTTPSSPTLQPTSVLSTESLESSLETNVQDFWSSFPCPPPWRPHLLFEVNVSRFDPLVSRTVRSFLAGKCDLRHDVSGFDRANNLGHGDLNVKLDFRPTDSSDPRTAIGGQISHYEWCDTTCQLSFGCALFFVVAVMVVSLLVCINKNRVRHKMVATRPSRQQLQLSTSTSDAANCTEFSNLEIQGEEVIYPPFRHRGLPNPPRSCHRSCDPNWNCPNCSSCRPLMSPSRSDQYYSHTYSAVYESIDDTDEEACLKEEEIVHHPRDTMPSLSEQPDSNQSSAPFDISQTLFDTIQKRPVARSDPRENQKFAETKFNGEELSGTMQRSRLPNYFELEKNCALSPPYENVNQSYRQLNCPVVNSLSKIYNKPPAIGPSQHPLTQPPCEFPFPMLGDTPLHSFVMSQVKHNAIPNASEFYKPKANAELTNASNAGEDHKDPHLKSPTVLPEYGREHLNKAHTPLQDGQHRCCLNIQNDQSRQLKRHCQHDVQNSKTYTSHVCTTASTFFPNIPSHNFCPTCQQNTSGHLVNVQGVMSMQQPMKATQTILPGFIAPDLLNEASNHSRKVGLKSNGLNNKNNDKK